MSAPRTLEAFMAQALAMELEAVARYTEFADAMEIHNNQDVAAMFRTMAGYEGKHAVAIREQMGWTEATSPAPDDHGWPGFEAPETVPLEDVHYLMQPWHALHLALEAEQRAVDFFGQLAAATDNDAVRAAALEMQQEEVEHVALVKAWLKKVPEPDPDWDEDPDPPRYNES